MAVEAASFSTVMFSISFGFNVLKTLDVMGAPSKMNNGVVPALIELTPRRRIEAVAVGSPVLDNTDRPETCPANASVKFVVGVFSMVSLFTVPSDPTTDPSFLAVP